MTLPTGREDDLTARLRAAGCVFAEDEARLLRAAASTEASLNALLLRRLAGVPLEQVVGWAEFRGLRIRTAPGVFVPRRRTEFLVELALSELPGPATGTADPVLVDLCCGTGAVAAAVACAAPHARVHAVDNEPAAVRCAHGNLPGAEGVHLGDLYAPLPGELRRQVAVITANAPYVPSDAVDLLPPEARDHEPRGALDGGRDGLDIQRRVIAGAGQWLAPGGQVLVETSGRQADGTAELMARHGLRVQVCRSAELDATVVAGGCP